MIGAVLALRASRDRFVVSAAPITFEVPLGERSRASPDLDTLRQGEVFLESHEKRAARWAALLFCSLNVSDYFSFSTASFISGTALKRSATRP